MSATVSNAEGDAEFVTRVLDRVNHLAAEELLYLIQLSRMAPADLQLIDLGTYEGGALAALCYGGDDTRALGITSVPNKSLALSMLEDLGFQPPVLTYETGEIVPATVEPKVGMVFSDTGPVAGTTSKFWRLEETKLWASRVEQHGILALHIHIGPNDNRVREIADEICKECWEELEQTGMVIAFRRK